MREDDGAALFLRHSRVAGVHVFESAVYGSPLREDGGDAPFLRHSREAGVHASRVCGLRIPAARG